MQYDEEWKRYRRCRVTASVFSNVNCFNSFEYRGERRGYGPVFNKSADLIEDILTVFSPYDAACRYGVDSKGAARAMYLQQAGDTHGNPRSVRIELCGLIIDENYPLIAASPNALITCDCCPDGVLQVKCTYKHRNTHPRDIPYRDRKYDLHYNRQGYLALRPSSRWYYQAIANIGVTKRAYCDLVAYTDAGIAIIRVNRDQATYYELVAQAHKIYKKHILKKLRHY